MHNPAPLHVFSGACVSRAFIVRHGLPQCVRFGAAVLSLLLASPTLAQSGTIVVRSREQATDSPYEVFRRFISDNAGLDMPAPILNDQGDVLFFAALGGSVGSADKAVFVHSGSGFRMAARRYTIVPGYPAGTSFQSFPSVLLADNGDAIVKATLTGPNVQMGINDVGIWRNTLNTMVQLARTAESAPQTTPAAAYKLILEPVVARAPTAASLTIPARVRNTSTLTEHDGVWIPGSGTPRRVMQSYLAPGTGGAVFSAVRSIVPLAGPAIYSGQLTGGDVQQLNFAGTLVSNGSGLWSDSGASVPTLFARTGMLLTGSASGPVLSSLHGVGRDPAGASDGSVLFSGSAISAATGAALGDGLWRWRAGGIERVFLAGEPVLNGGGLTVASVVSSATCRTIEDCGGVAVFVAQLAGPGVTYQNEAALLQPTSNGLALIARARSQAPGCATGQVFTQTSLVNNLACAASGKWAFNAMVQGPGVTTATDRGIWSVDAGQATLALREGMQVGGFVIAEIRNAGASLQVCDDGRLLVESDISYVGDPYGTRYAALIAWSPCGGASVLLSTGQALQLSDGSSFNLVSFRSASSGMLSRSGEAVVAVALASGIPEDEAVVRLTLPGCNPCPADYDNSGVLTSQDIFAFLTDWFLGNADFDQSGVTEVTDIFAFLSDWYEGCD